MTRMRVDLRRAGRVLLVGLAFLFIGLALVSQRERLLAYPWRIEPVRLAASAVAFGVVLVVSVGIWGRTLRHFDVRPPFPVLARIWFVSNLNRYIPGKIWQFIGVIDLSRAAGISALTSVTSLLLYMGFVLVAGAILGIYLVPGSLIGVPDGWRLGLRWAAPALLGLLHPAVINTVIGWTTRLTRRPLRAWTGRWSDGLAIFALCVLEWLALGAAFTLFVGSITPVGFERYPALTGAFALSFVAGYMVLLPAGLGAKEGALAVLLGGVLPFPVAAAVAVAARVWTLLAELLPTLIFLVPARRWAPPPGAADAASLEDPC
ncbi:MAG TPA: hypothetical protein VF188_04775 [Longimicrobiales bacterium]